ncbi:MULTISPECIES: hypothetical protein [Achromobacter]|uniref:hypothetical protein n=1 Tax=Achromobacter TaxID=222 RepID=UPI000F8F8506|nr:MULTISPECIES: hypothetical protein [Achromobacter]AZS78422.1 hypothetical protein ELS24_08180 [Achromobacter spanius]MCD0496098.1 hypothetical protein [Achromobacter sp. MY14]MCW3153142.1 hypothetical protein [Achromobacter spanius]
MNTTPFYVAHRSSARMGVRQGRVGVESVVVADAWRARAAQAAENVINDDVISKDGANEKGPAHSPGLDQFGCGGRI